MITTGRSPELKRILVLSNRYYPYYKGGYGLRCKSITDELIKRGYDVHVLTSNWHAPKKQTNGNIHRLLHVRKPVRRNPFHRRWQHLQWALTSRIDYRIARRLMQTLAPDIVYVWNMGQLSLSPVAAAQALGSLLVFDLGDYWLLRRYQELCLEPDQRKRSYRLFIHGIKSFDPSQFSHILTNSKALKQRYVEAGFPAEHISIIPRGLQAHFILDTPHPVADCPTIELLHAGRLTEAKGAHLAIQTVALLTRELASELGKPVHLDIVGEGDPSYVHHLQELVVSLELQQTVRFVGKVSQEELFDLYKRYDAVLIPSIWVEPFGGVAIEAMAQGTCVIASERGGPAEHITHGQDGLLVPPEDPRAMARAVIALVQDRNLRDRIRYAAIATVREHYAIEKVGDQVEAYLNTALAKHLPNRKG